MMKHIGVAAFAAVSFGIVSLAHAQQQPEMGVPMRLMDQSGYALGTAKNPVVTTGASASAAVSPTAFTPTAIATANTYQQAAATGKAATQGGFLQAASANTGNVCLDTSSGASAGLTTPTGGQICATPGSTITFTATPSAVYVYGPAGATFTGSAQ